MHCSHLLKSQWPCIPAYIYIYLYTGAIRNPGGVVGEWLNAYMHTCIHTYMHTYIIHTYIHTCIHAYIHTYIIHTYIHTYIHTFIGPTHIDTYTHTHDINTHTPTDRQVFQPFRLAGVTHCHTYDGGCVSLEHLDRGALGDVPRPDCAVGGAGEQVLASRVGRHARHCSQVARQHLPKKSKNHW